MAVASKLLHTHDVEVEGGGRAASCKHDRCIEQNIEDKNANLLKSSINAKRYVSVPDAAKARFRTLRYRC
jgi:hypothetical protein